MEPREDENDDEKRRAQFLISEDDDDDDDCDDDEGVEMENGLQQTRLKGEKEGMEYFWVIFVLQYNDSTAASLLLPFSRLPTPKKHIIKCYIIVQIDF